MSTVDTSTWSPDTDNNTAIEGIPLNADSPISQTWLTVRALMAALKGDGDAIKAMISVMEGATASADGKQGLVPKPEAGDQDKVLKGDGTWGTLSASDIPNIDASKITSGTIDIARLPAGALERLVTVADQTARYALTINDVQLGDTVKEEDSGLLYFVVDTSKLNSADGYEVYTAGAATSVPWSGVTGKPSTFTPSSHSHGSITNDGKVGSTANLPLITGTGGVVQAGSFGNSANTFCQGNDSRLSDARTPTSHTHGNVTNDGKVGTASGKPLITGSGGAVTAGSFGTTSGTFCEGNDSRLSDSRTPKSHAHGNISNGGAIGSTSGLPVVTGANGVLQAGSFGTAAGTVCEGNDSRLSNARTPTSHTHGSITNDGKLGTASRVVVTDGSKVIGVSSITTTKLGYLTDVTSNIQGQIDGKADSATTLAGYGITDAKIASGTITLGSSTITPLTSSSSLDASKLTGTASVNTTGKATTAGTADKVANKLTLKLKSGSTEGTDLYTYDGSGAKTLDIKQGSNITLTAASGSLTIAGVGDTKNTAGSTDSSLKLFLIGATSQAANPQTYSHDTAYVGTDGCLYSGGTKVLTAHQDISGKADKATTLAGYGITDAKIENGVITLGSNTITPLTSHQSLSNYVTLNSAQTISAVKTFTAKPVLNQVGLDMTVKDTTEGSTTTRTSQVLHANSSNGQYGINIAFCSGGNAVVGGGEAGTAQLSDLAGNSGENLYLVADGNIYFKSNGNTWANAKTLSYTNGGNLSFANSNITRGTNPSSNIERAFQWNDSAENRLAVISNVYHTDSSSITALYAYKTTAATGNNIGRLGIGCDSSGNVFTEAPTPSSTTDNTTKIATTAWVRTATGNFACNAATATQFSANKSVTLTGDVTGSASSKAGWSIATTVGAITNAQIVAMFENDGIDPDDPPMTYPERAVLCGDGAWRYFEQIPFPEAR